MRIEPDAIGLFSRRVVLIGVSEGALAFQIIGCRCGLGQRRYYCMSSATVWPAVAILPTVYCWCLVVSRHNIAGPLIPLSFNWLLLRLYTACDLRKMNEVRKITALNSAEA